MVELSKIDSLYFACSGNTCRSPMAERIFAQWKTNHYPSIQVGSRRATVESGRRSPGGYVGEYGAGSYKQPLSLGSAAIIWRFFEDSDFIKKHTARSFTSDELAKADLVLTMSRDHKNCLLQHIKGFTDDKYIKVYTLGETAGLPDHNVSDPYGSDKHLLETLYVIENCLIYTADLVPRPDMLDLDSKVVKNRVLEYVNERRRGDNPLSDTELLAHFGEERMEELRVQAYLPTYQELTQLICCLLDKGEVEPVTISQLFAQEVAEHLARLNKKHTGRRGLSTDLKENLSMHAASPEKKFQGTPYGAFLRGDYVSAAQKVGEARKEAVGMLRNLALQYLTTARSASKSGRVLQPLSTEFCNHLANVVLPDLIQSKTYLNEGWEVDYAALGKAFNIDHFRQAVGVIPAVVEEADLAGAFDARKFAHMLLAVTEKMYKPKVARGLYNELSN